MSTLFIVYTSLCVISVTILFVLGYFTFFNKKIRLKDWFYIFVGLVLFETFSLTITKGVETNDNLIVEFKVPKDIYTNIELEEDTSLTDQMLYTYLNEMRVPHAKIVLCQAKIESAQYGSVLYKRQNNLFGMKIPRKRATSGTGGKAGYQGYNNWRESVTDYVLWQYSHNVDKLSHEDYLKYLGKVYAEDPNYVTKIKNMLKQINFKKLER